MDSDNLRRILVSEDAAQYEQVFRAHWHEFCKTFVGPRGKSINFAFIDLCAKITEVGSKGYLDVIVDVASQVPERRVKSLPRQRKLKRRVRVLYHSAWTEDFIQKVQNIMCGVKSRIMLEAYNPDDWKVGPSARFQEAAAILGIPVLADNHQIRTAYRRRSRDTHPDKVGPAFADAFLKVQWAYNKMMGTV